MPESALACQPQSRYVSLVERKDPERADPITRVVATRVGERRRKRHMSGAALGAAVRVLGLARWVPSTVGKLETRRREAVTVREWLALSVALDVPPALLLADPRHGEPVPVADGHVLDPWRALLWLVGSSTINGGIVSHPQGSEDMDLIASGRVVAEVVGMMGRTPVERLDLFRGGLAMEHGWAVRDSADDDVVRRSLDELHRRGLETMRVALERIQEIGAAVPQLEPYVLQRAVELGVYLPGQEGESS